MTETPTLPGDEVCVSDPRCVLHGGPSDSPVFRCSAAQAQYDAAKGRAEADQAAEDAAEDVEWARMADDRGRDLDAMHRDRRRREWERGQRGAAHALVPAALGSLGLARRGDR